MKRRFFLLLLVLLLLIGFLWSIKGIYDVVAQGDVKMKNSVLASCASYSGGEGVKVNATMGLTGTGVSSSGDTTLSYGFWTWIEEVIEEFLHFLPVIFQ